MIFKKYLSIFSAILLLMLTSCNSAENTSTLEDTVSTTTTTLNISSSNEVSSSDVLVANAEQDTIIDIDLTSMSSNMVYAEVYAIFSQPEDYLGKTIKIQGQFSPFYSEETNTTYYYVTVADATACCQQGFEFIWDSNKHTYPNEYPTENSTIEIFGTISTYDELGQTYCYIATDNIAII